jgi:hypothetical protein
MRAREEWREREGRVCRGRREREGLQRDKREAISVWRWRAQRNAASGRVGCAARRGAEDSGARQHNWAQLIITEAACCSCLGAKWSKGQRHVPWIQAEGLMTVVAA